MLRIGIARIVAVFMLAGPVLWAQQAPPPSLSANKTPWKLEFTVNELEGGKLANEYHYSTLVLAPGAVVVSAGDQVPVQTNVNNTISTQFINFALKISCQVGDTLPQGSTAVTLNFELSRIPSERKGADNLPIHSVGGVSSFTLNPGKKDVVLVVDDVVGKRQYQVSILATKPN